MELAYNDWPPYRPAALAMIETSLRAGILVDGPNTAALERAWAEDTGAPYCLACSSGTAALYLALAALGVAGREVVVPAFTFSGSVFPIIMAGATPVFADVDPRTYCVTAETVERVLSPRTAAVMPVHLHGYPIDLRPLRDLLPANVPIIEDACQGAGSELPGGLRAGRFGLAGAFSLNQTKALPGGEGGLVVTDDPEFCERMRTLRRFGERWDEKSPRTYIVHDPRGGNYRIDELCAAVAVSHIPHLAAITEQARRNADILLRYLEGLPGLALPASEPGHSWQKFRVRTTSAAARDHALASLTEARVPVCRWQVAAMPDHDAFHDPNADVPQARTLLEDSFLIFTERWPLHGQTEEVVETIGNTIRSVWEGPG